MSKQSRKDNLLLGAHVSISGGMHKAIERGETIGASAIQIFTKNNRSYKGTPLTPETIDAFKQAQKNSPVKYVVVHCSYLINVGASNPDVEKKSVDALKHELERCHELGIKHLVIHPGSHTGAGEEVCIKKIAHNVDKVLRAVKGETMILLETAAGQGTNVGYSFEQIRHIYDLCEEKDRVGVCFDTCHVFAAGYDLSTPEGYKQTWDDFKKTIGIRKLKVIHLNDSKMVCGSRKDRHQNLFKGQIPKKTFELIMNDENLESIPKVLETPSDDGITEYTHEIKLLKGLM